ncbi:50S ribosomal protein L21, mitochondrial [Juglans microcarpa x Juglans regia]|uniref:50S ribosomal protein L21, mitochondrial n=1 Tax=Juglans microcarpa x Juglans regia TaxID=2249226 RepID=UPI001B7E1420|nr:50S ribosomal protein L21, mitochondrial [Juglans microcarpa x Juglans regia]
MANRRCLLALTRYTSALFSTNISLSFHLTPLPLTGQSLKTIASKLAHDYTTIGPTRCSHWSHPRHFSSNRDTEAEGEDEDAEDDDDDDDDEELCESSEDENDGNASVSNFKTEYTAEEREAEAAAIGYKVVGPLERSDWVFKSYEPIFAVVQIGSHQFKVSNGDCIFTERLKFCEVNDKLILNKILLLGSSSQTIIGRPIVPDGAVHAVVEEHALDAKVIIFKKKRRKNYRRTKGHRQELTKLRITDIQGIEKPEKIATGTSTNSAGKKPEKVAVAA